jgi:hypothetical protein
MTTAELVLAALEKGLVIHGLGPAEKDARYPEPVYSVMISAASKTKILVYGGDTGPCHETCLRNAIEKALERAASNVKPLK